MSTERHVRVKRLFFAASELDPAAAEAFLARECEGDLALREEVRSLLGALETGTDYFRPIVGEAPSFEPSTRGEGTRRPHLPSKPSTQTLSRFPAGALVADRYRIVTRLGQGGMGEVYRAEDLRLQQEVALKFLPREVGSSASWLASLHNEVRTAREISHPNVCRVYDLIEVGTETFIAMEYVDGEDLASLIRRIGRLPIDKAMEIGRQICAGVGAAHAQGVLHRDLKPSNIMVDGRGKVRITDFGLAAKPHEVSGSSRVAGTPAYMAPEQLTGGSITLRSDLYTLGLVLYELFTGQPVFEARSPAERAYSLRRQSIPEPSRLAAGIPTEVEHQILRCLQLQPRERPRSAAEVAVALSGGDPLEAALAAGETPSPEMVAATPSQGRFRVGLALLSFLSFVVVTVSTVWMTPRARALHRSGLDKAPTVLVDRAQRHLETFAATPAPLDTAWGFTVAPAIGEYLLAAESGWRPWDSRPPELGAPGPPAQPLYFWYREAAEGHLAPVTAANFALGPGRTLLADPPTGRPGTSELLLDPSGGLVLFRSHPPVVEALRPPAVAGAEPDWAPFFTAARLPVPPEGKDVPPEGADGVVEREAPVADAVEAGAGGLERVLDGEVAPGAPLTVPCDLRRAWDVAVPASPGESVRVEAAAWRGRPVFFGVFELVERAPPAPVAGRFPVLSRGLLREISTVLFLITVCVALPVAWRNHRLGRSDRRGALRIALVWFGLRVSRWVLQGTHVPEPHKELEMTLSVLGTALLETALFWTIYSALEPLVRRYLPRTLISWNRLLAGRVRDALVGLDLSVGAAVGATWALFAVLSGASPERLAGAASEAFLDPYAVEPLRGARHIVATALGLPLEGIAAALQLVLQLALLRAVLQSTRAAVVVLVLLHGSLEVLAAADPWQALATQTLPQTLVAVVLLVRFGLTMVCAAYFVYYLLLAYPVTWDLSVWYADASLFAIVIAVAFSLFALQTSRAALRSEMQGHL